MQNIDSNKAKDFYKLLTKAGCSSQDDTAKMIKIRRAIENLFNHLCSDEDNMNDKKLFEQMQYLFAKYSENFKENIKSSAHEVRILVNKIAHGQIATAQNVKDSLQNVAILIHAVSNESIPDYLKNVDLLPQHCLTLNHHVTPRVSSQTNQATQTTQGNQSRRANMMILNTMVLDDDYDFATNSTARLPIALVLDVSGSMTGQKIQQLNDGVRAFYQSVTEDPIAQYSAEIAIIAFNDKVSLVSDFKSVSKYSHTDLIASGTTCLAQGVQVALDTLSQRKQKYRDNGLEYFQPWIVLMTDGQSTEDANYISQVAKNTADLVNTRKLCVIPIGIGNGANLLELKSFSPDLPPLRLNDLKFREFFQWLSSSVSRQSNSIPGGTDRPDFDKDIAIWLSPNR